MNTTVIDDLGQEVYVGDKACPHIWMFSTREGAEAFLGASENPMFKIIEKEGKFFAVIKLDGDKNMLAILVECYKALGGRAFSKALWSALLEGTKDAWERLVGFFKKFPDFIKDLWNKARAYFRDLLKGDGKTWKQVLVVAIAAALGFVFGGIGGGVALSAITIIVLILLSEKENSAELKKKVDMYIDLLAEALEDVMGEYVTEEALA